MQTFTLNPRRWGVGSKITIFTLSLLCVILAILLTLINASTSSMLKERAKANVASTLGGISNTVEVFNAAMTNEASSFARLFAAGFANGKFTLEPDTTVDIGGKPTPTLKHDGKTLNLDFSIPDKFTGDTGVVATIFAASGDEFVRVSTSLKKENGERAVGTQLDHAHPSYSLLRAGGSYIGLATLFGKQYITQYDPIKDSGGKVIGVLFIGLDISKNMAMLKEKSRPSGSARPAISTSSTPRPARRRGPSWCTRPRKASTSSTPAAATAARSSRRCSRPGKAACATTGPTRTATRRAKRWSSSTPSSRGTG